MMVEKFILLHQKSGQHTFYDLLFALGIKIDLLYIFLNFCYTICKNNHCRNFDQNNCHFRFTETHDIDFAWNEISNLATEVLATSCRGKSFEEAEIWERLWMTFRLLWRKPIVICIKAKRHIEAKGKCHGVLIERSRANQYKTVILLQFLVFIIERTW